MLGECMTSKIMVILSGVFLCASAFAISPDQADFSQIRMEGLQVLNSDGFDSLGYKLRRLNNPSVTLMQELESQSNSTIVSPIYDLDEASALKNLYVYIGKTPEGTFEFVEVFHNSRGGMFVVDMNIVNVEKDHMDLTHGPSDEIETYKVISTLGDLFP